MTKLLAEFEFDNAEFDITEQTINNIYLKIYRELVCITNTSTIYRMPVGSNGGLATRMVALYKGQPDEMVWELRHSKKRVIGQGYTSDQIIPLPMPTDSSKKFSLSIYTAGTRNSKNNCPDINIDTKHKIELLRIRNNIIAKLQKSSNGNYTVKYGSEHLDNSTYNLHYKRSIRIEMPNRVLYHLYLYNNQNAHMMNVYTFYDAKRPVEKSIIPLGDIKMDKLLRIILKHIYTKDTYFNTLRSSPVASL